MQNLALRELNTSIKMQEHAAKQPRRIGGKCYCAFDNLILVLLPGQHTLPSQQSLRHSSYRYKGKKGHLPNADTVTNLTDSEDSEDDFNALDANVQECLNDMAKPGARTAWAGWFPKSFSKLLASFGIPTATAHSLALAIRDYY